MSTLSFIASKLNVIKKALFTAPRASFGDPQVDSYATGGSSFDAANDSGYRSSTAGFNIDSHREILPAARREVVKKSRSLRNNLPFYRAIGHTAAQLSIGWGLQPMPKSGNKAYDTASIAYWKRWANSKDCDVSGKHDHAGLQMLACLELQFDGEIFINKTVDAFGRRQRQFIKTEQVGNGLTLGYGPQMGSLGTDNWVDGILLDPQMKELIIRVLKRQLPGTAPLANSVMTFEELPAGQVLHLYEKETATRNRGLPWGYCGMNDLIDCLDINVFEKVARKLNASIIASLTTPTGAPPASMEAMLRAQAMQNRPDATPSTGKPGVSYLNLNGSMIPLFRAGENLSFFTQGRQVTNVIDFAWALMNGVAAAYGLPVETVLGWSKLGGASVRATTEMAGRFFERVQRLMIKDMCQPDWEDIVGTGILAYLYPKDFPFTEPLAPPPGFTGWNTVTWRGPRNITVDKARDGKMMLELMRAGKMTDEEWWVEIGEDPGEMPDLCDREVAEGLERWVTKYKLPEEHFWRRLFGPQSMQHSTGGDSSGEPAEPPADAQALLHQIRDLLTSSARAR